MLYISYKLRHTQTFNNSFFTAHLAVNYWQRHCPQKLQNKYVYIKNNSTKSAQPGMHVVGLEMNYP